MQIFIYWIQEQLNLLLRLDNHIKQYKEQRSGSNSTENSMMITQKHTHFKMKIFANIISKMSSVCLTSLRPPSVLVLTEEILVVIKWHLYTHTHTHRQSAASGNRLPLGRIWCGGVRWFGKGKLKSDTVTFF